MIRTSRPGTTKGLSMNAKKRVGGSIAGAAALGALLIASPARGDVSVSPGKNAIFVSVSDFAVPRCCSAPHPVVASGTIERGKRRYVVAIDGMLQLSGWQTSTEAPSIYATVNGIEVEPSLYPSGGSIITTTSCPTERCTVTGMFFVDLDEAEARFPGYFIGKPLHIELHAASYSGREAAGLSAVLRARLDKK